ncbi:hypothetical protein [Phytohabitans rumicis]|uniref:aa3-type cytochrome oxidase subunit CtaJ n=1 Tax=Phytohabitans rumicis TaxID=1076125 RepID=UPI0015630EB1|nr:hypothetical protein [Phytohabitans rumicis]
MLVFAGIPAAIILVVAGLAALGGGRSAKRYRPGRPFDFAPVWFLAAPEQLAGVSGSDHAALPAGSSRAELTAATPARINPTGGASDRW